MLHVRNYNQLVLYAHTVAEIQEIFEPSARAYQPIYGYMYSIINFPDIIQSIYLGMPDPNSCSRRQDRPLAEYFSPELILRSQTPGLYPGVTALEE